VQVDDVGGGTDPVDVIIDTVRLEIVPVAGDGGAPGTALDCPSCSEPCAAGEDTTSFDVPPGDYLLSIEALRCGVPVGYTPPAVQRSVRVGEITNLNAVEILIPPGVSTPASCGDGGAPGRSDGGA
jgi:hypothetical protein